MSRCDKDPVNYRDPVVLTAVIAWLRTQEIPWPPPTHVAGLQAKRLPGAPGGERVDEFPGRRIGD